MVALEVDILDWNIFSPDILNISSWKSSITCWLLDWIINIPLVGSG